MDAKLPRLSGCSYAGSRPAPPHPHVKLKGGTMGYTLTQRPRAGLGHGARLRAAVGLLALAVAGAFTTGGSAQETATCFGKPATITG
jgi:hypothetical protein